MKMHKFLLMLLLLWAVGTSAPVLAQAAETSSAAISEVGMADVMRQDGKIYIVVAVLATVMLGILLYLINLDKKIGRLEKELRQ